MTEPTQQQVAEATAAFLAKGGRIRQIEKRTPLLPAPEVEPDPAVEVEEAAAVKEIPRCDLADRTQFLTTTGHWTRDQITLLHAEYPTADLDDLARRLGRPLHQLYSKASVLRLRRLVRNMGRKRKHQITPEIDAEIRRVYQSAHHKNQINQLAARIRWPRWKVTRRAIQLGLIRQQKKEPPWSEREIGVLEQWGHLCPEVIRRKLKKAGFPRTVTGIVLKRKRMNLTAPYSDHGFTATKLAQAFGVDSKVVTGWIEKGWLVAGRRGSGRTPQQGGDMWWITRRAVRRFIIESVDVIEIAKVDKWWLVDILT